jgi:DNA-binding XRE family transcriptional regulator
LGTAAGAYKAFGLKEGGAVKGLAMGGMGDRTGAAQQSESAQGIKAQLLAMPADQVAQVAQTSPSETVRAMANEVLMEKRMQAQAEKQAEQSIMRDEMPRGLTAVPASSMDTIGAAGGGIVAFAGEEGSQVEEDDEYTKYITAVQNMRARAGIEGSPIDPKLRGMYEERMAALPGRRESDVGMDMIDFFSRMNRPGSIVKAATDAAGEALPGIAKRRADLRAEELAATTGLAGLTRDERAEMLGISKDAMALREKELDREKALKAARIGAGPREDSLDKSTKTKLDYFTAPKEEGGLGLPNNAKTRSMARSEAISEAGLASPKLSAKIEADIIDAEKNIDKKYALEKMMALNDPDKLAAVETKIANEKSAKANELRSKLNPTTAAPPPPPGPGGGKFSSTGAVVVQTPAGPINFPNKEAADAYKKAAGL